MGSLGLNLTHWARVTHICFNKLTIIGSDNGLSPGRRQAIIWTNAGLLLTGSLGTKFSEILIEIHTFLFKKIYLKMLSAKWRQFCLGLLREIWIKMWDFSVKKMHSKMCLKNHGHFVSTSMFLPSQPVMSGPWPLTENNSLYWFCANAKVIVKEITTEWAQQLHYTFLMVNWLICNGNLHH